MGKTEDPFYNRKPVPDEFIQDVGISDLSREEELANRERKLSVNGVDVRKFFNSKKHYDDPYYGRKPVSKEETIGVGETGLSPDQAEENRERKLSVNGVDVRKFWDSKKHYDDPYYGRAPVSKNEIVGIGDTGLSKAEEFEVRDRKQSVFQLDSDPFSQITGRGNRASISAAALPVALDAARRRSSINPNAAAYASGQSQQPDAISSANPTNGTKAPVFNQQPNYQQSTIQDPDSVDPMERR